MSLTGLPGLLAEVPAWRRAELAARRSQLDAAERDGTGWEQRLDQAHRHSRRHVPVKAGLLKKRSRPVSPAVRQGHDANARIDEARQCQSRICVRGESAERIENLLASVTRGFGNDVGDGRCSHLAKLSMIARCRESKTVAQ